MGANKPYHTTKKTVFAINPHKHRDENQDVTKYVTLVHYCKTKFVSRDQVRTLIKKKWLAVTKAKGRIYVSELCPDLIDEYLE